MQHNEYNRKRQKRQGRLIAVEETNFEYGEIIAIYPEEDRNVKDE